MSSNIYIIISIITFYQPLMHEESFALFFLYDFRLITASSLFSKIFLWSNYIYYYDEAPYHNNINIYLFHL
jgi:hypothetical protein